MKKTLSVTTVIVCCLVFSAAISAAEADSPEIFQVFKSLVIQPGSSCATTSFVVPAKSRLIVEHVSLRGRLPLGQRLTTIEVNLSWGTHFLVPTVTASDGTFDWMTAAQPMRAYAEPNVSVSLQLCRTDTDTTGQGGFFMALSGQLVNAGK